MKRRTPPLSRQLPRVAACLLAGALAPAALADDVHLTNGRVFEDVIARIDGERVVVRLDTGEIILPRSRVARIVAGETPMERFRAAERRLLERADATAADWLELARSAHRDGFEAGYKRALLAAARRQPVLPEVAALLGDLGYVRDDLLGEWLPREQALRRRGLVRWGDEWLPAAEVERRREAQAEVERERREQRRQDRLAHTLQTVAELEVIRRLAPPPPPLLMPVAGYPIVTLPWLWQPPAAGPAPPAPPPPSGPTEPPGGAAEANRGGFEPPGRLGTGVVPPPGSLGGG